MLLTNVALSTSMFRVSTAAHSAVRPYQSTALMSAPRSISARATSRSEEHTSELQSLRHLVCRLLLEKKKTHALPPTSRRTLSNHERRLGDRNQARCRALPRANYEAHPHPPSQHEPRHLRTHFAATRA